MDRRSRGRRIAVWVFWLSLAPLLGEAIVRGHFVRPARQILRGHGLHDVQGVPIWKGDDAAQRDHTSCAEQHPERIRIAFFGASVTYGDEVSANETFASLLEQRLNAARPSPGFCVLNFSSPGFLHDQRMTLAREELPRWRPALAIYQDGDDEWNGELYRMLGDAAYDVGTLKLRADGFPGLPGVPDAVNRSLFLHSELYQYLVLARGESIPMLMGRPDQQPGRERRRAAALAFVRLARSFGARPAFLVAADVPHASNQLNFERTVEQPLIELGKSEGFPVLILRDELPDSGGQQIRVDFRHFNAAGHQAVATRLETFVLDLVDSPPAH